MKIHIKTLVTYAFLIVALYVLSVGSVYLVVYRESTEQLRRRQTAAPQEPGRATATENRDIRYQMDRIACEETARFVIDHMLKAPAFPNKFLLFDRSLAAVDPRSDGLYCEFGVGSGSTINYIASKTKRPVHGFDSFEGLPETWRTGYEKGAFAVPTLPKVPDHVKLHKGWFNESLPIWAKANSGPIAFLHMDADLYSSTKTVFDILGDRIVPGTVIQFDEYFNYPGWQGGEHKAFTEFIQARHATFEYLGYCELHEQVAVRILTIGAARAESK